MNSQYIVIYYPIYIIITSMFLRIFILFLWIGSSILRKLDDSNLICCSTGLTNPDCWQILKNVYYIYIYSKFLYDIFILSLLICKLVF